MLVFSMWFVCLCVAAWSSIVFNLCNGLWMLIPWSGCVEPSIFNIIIIICSVIFLLLLSMGFCLVCRRDLHQGHLVDKRFIC